MSLSSMPACGVSCVVSSLSYASCAATNLTCLCADTAYEAVVAKCITANCTVIESLSVENISRVQCGIPETNHDASVIAQTLVHFFLQTIFFGLRMLCRAVRIAPWGWDDTTIVIAYILVTGVVGAAFFTLRNGLGRNIWVLTPVQITTFLKVYWTFEMLYTVTLGTIKISICFLYLRLFPGEKFRRLVWATLIFNLFVLVAFSFSSVFQCRPLSYFWSGWDGEQKGTCDNINAAAWAHAVINIVLDVWMLGLPASQVWRLNAPMRKKIEILAMFGFGIFLTIVSIVRLKSLYTFKRTRNPTNDLLSASIWSSLEITVGLIVACMPAARLFVVRYIPRLTTCFSRGNSRASRAKFESNGSSATPATIGSGGGGGGGGAFGTRSRAWRFQRSRKSGRAARDTLSSELDEDLAAVASGAGSSNRDSLLLLEPPRAYIASHTSREELLSGAAPCTTSGCAPEDEPESLEQTAARGKDEASAEHPPDRVL